MAKVARRTDWVGANFWARERPRQACATLAVTCRGDGASSTQLDGEVEPDLVSKAGPQRTGTRGALLLESNGLRHMRPESIALSEREERLAPPRPTDRAAAER